MREIIFLNEETPTLDNLNEDILLEGRILNAIRWRLAKFTLRFLKESAIDEFLKAYYTDKDGKLAPKGKEWLTKSKKEKIKKMRELADNLPAEDKEKVIKSEGAIRLERQAALAGLVTAAAGVVSSVSKSHSEDNLSRANNAKYDAEVKTYDYLKSENLPTDRKYMTLSGHAVTPRNDNVAPIQVNDIQIKGEPSSHEVAIDNLASLSASCTRMASILHGTMIGALITTAAGAVGTISKAHKANVVRREEIMKELLAGKKNLKEDVELITADYLISLLG